MLSELVKRNRSYRRFFENEIISAEDLRYLVNLTRYVASGRNAQPLKYQAINSVEENAAVFQTLRWAGFLKDWNGPVEGERPAAYIIILGDKSISSNFYCDHGIAAQTILLGATELGLGGCMIAAVDKTKLHQFLNLSSNLEVLLVLALGRPKEKVIIEKMDELGDYKYWRDEEKVHHVPKRNLDEILIK
jgi:nitroreductase